MTAGPEMATRYILAQETSEFWTDGLWSDGGLVLDLVAHRLLFFGDEIMRPGSSLATVVGHQCRVERSATSLQWLSQL